MPGEAQPRQASRGTGDCLRGLFLGGPSLEGHGSLGVSARSHLVFHPLKVFASCALRETLVSQVLLQPNSQLSQRVLLSLPFCPQSQSLGTDKAPNVSCMNYHVKQ